MNHAEASRHIAVIPSQVPFHTRLVFSLEEPAQIVLGHPFFAGHVLKESSVGL
jgi:hypothetical protein